MVSDFEQYKTKRWFGEWLANPSFEEDLRGRLGELSGHLGFGRFAIAFYDQPANRDPISYRMNNYPDTSWITPDIVKRDPLVEVYRNGTETIMWEPKTYHETGNSDIWELGYTNGLAAGVVAINDISPNRRIIFSVSRDQDDPKSLAEIRAAASDVEQAAQAISGAFVAFYTNRASLSETLLPAELEMLKYIFAMWTDYMIADHLRKPHRDVRRLLNSARRKIGVKSDWDAAIAAAQSGLLGHI